MIIDEFQIYNWNIIILYEVTCKDINFIIRTLKEIKCPKQYIEEALSNLEECKLNTGLTYSNLKLKSSVIIISKASSFAQLLNTIAHEYHHLLIHIQNDLKINSEEESANLNGNLIMRSYNTVKSIEKVGS